MANPASDELVAKIRAGLEGVTRGPWIKSGVRSAYPERAKATWIGPDGGGIIGVLFSDLTPDEYRASMVDATWVWLAQPDNIAALLARLEAEKAAREKAEAELAQRTIERDAAGDNWRIDAERFKVRAMAAEADRDRLAAVVAEARKVIEPFADRASALDASWVSWTDDYVPVGTNTAGDFRAARAWQEKHGEAG